MTHVDPARAAGLAALPSDDAERAAAEAHARECDPCARLLAEGAAVIALVDATPPPAPSREALARVAARLARELRPPVLAPLLAAVAAWALLVALARHRPGASDARAWTDAAGVLLLALTASVLAGAWRRAAIAAALGASAALSRMAGAGGSLAPLIGVHCLLSEVASAALPAVALVWLARRRGIDVPPSHVAAVAAAGALAGQSALHLTCAARADAPHLWVFHTGGVVLAAVAASLLVRARIAPAHPYR